MMYIVIPIVGIIFFVYLSWQHAPTYCHVDLNSTSDVVMLNLGKCIDDCWKKNDFGNDLENTDCYVLNVYVQDRAITRNDFSSRKYVKAYFNSLESLSPHKLKIRYNATEKGIDLVTIE